MHIPEELVIRPPSEANSLLVRVTRGCDWNRCRFCGIYDLYGVPFSTRTVEEIIRDIDSLHAMYGDMFKTAFLGDANPMALPAAELIGVLKYLRSTFPSLERVTCYARASSLWKKSEEDLSRIHASGLDRVHTGMESGCDRVLALQKKGTNARQLVEAGTRTINAGLELSYYFLLGLGGKALWKEHALGTAEVVNLVKPHFLRVRRLWIHPMSRLGELVEDGSFIPQDAEGTVLELRDLLRNVDAEGSILACDHLNNYIRVYGRLNEERRRMLETVEDFLSLPDQARQEHYRSVPSVI